MATPKKLSADNGRDNKIYIDTSPTPSPQKLPPNNNGGTANARVKVKRQRQLQRQHHNNVPSNNNSRSAHRRTTHNNKENDVNHTKTSTSPIDLSTSPPANSNDGDWFTVNKEGKGVKQNPPRQMSMTIESNNTSSSRSASSYANVAARRVQNEQVVRNQQVNLVAKLQRDFKEWPQISDSVLLQTLNQHQFDEESTRSALIALPGLLDNNNGEDSSAHPPLQPGPSLPSSTPRVTSGLRPIPQKAARKPHSSRPPKSTLGDYLLPKMGEAEQSRTRSFDMAASSDGSSRPRSGNKAPMKSQKRGGTTEKSHADLIVLDHSDDDASGNELWTSIEEKRAVNEAVAIANTERETILDNFRSLYPNISEDILRRILDTSNYDVELAHFVCKNQGTASTKLDHGAACKAHEKLAKRLRNLPCYRANRRRGYIEHSIRILHPNNLPKELWSVYTQGQGKCPLPNYRKNGVSLDGETFIMSGGRMEACSSVQTVLAYSQGLPTSSFNYGNGAHFAEENRNVHGSLNLVVCNYVDVCPLSTPDGEEPPDKEEHCPKPTKEQIEEAADILHLKFHFLLHLGYGVLYLNFGGTAVEPIMKKVLQKLRDDESITQSMMERLCVVCKNNHMYRASYCRHSYDLDTVAGESALEDYTRTVTNATQKMCNDIKRFYNQVDCFRISLSLRPYACGDIFQHLVEDEIVAYVAPEGNAAAQKHMRETYKAQQSARSRKGGRKAYPNGIGAASKDQRSEWTRDGGRRSSGMDNDAIDSLVTLLRDASNSAKTFKDKVRAMSAVHEITNIRNNPSIRWHFCIRADVTFASQIRGDWREAPQRYYVKVVPKSSSRNLQQALTATMDVMIDDHAFQSKPWTEIEKALVKMLGGGQPFHGANKKTVLVPGTEFTMTETEDANMKLLQEYAREHRVGGETINLPNQRHKKYGKLYHFVADKAKSLKTSKRASTKERMRHMLEKIKRMGIDLEDYDPDNY